MKTKKINLDDLDQTKAFKDTKYGDMSHRSVKNNKIIVSSMDLFSLEGAPKNLTNSHFYCTNNHLSTLEHSPITMDGVFSVSSNRLTSLKGSPTTIGGDFDISFNELRTLEDGPTTVSGRYVCNNNKLTSLKGAPINLKKDFDCSYNQDLKSLEFAPKNVGQFICIDIGINKNDIKQEIIKHQIKAKYDYIISNTESFKFKDIEQEFNDFGRLDSIHSKGFRALLGLK